MKSSILYFYALLCAVLFLGSCKLTEKAVIGKWKAITWGEDTLLIHNDHSVQFLYGQQAMLAGKWRIEGKLLLFQLESDSIFFMGGCTGLQSSGGFLRKRRLLRFLTCDKPTHRFKVYRKYDDE